MSLTLLPSLIYTLPPILPPKTFQLCAKHCSTSHNMDATETFMLEASTFFVEENLPRFLRGLPLLNVVDKSAGY